MKIDSTPCHRNGYVLTFEYNGQTYFVDCSGRINANGIRAFSNSWIFKGGSRHIRRNGIDVTRGQAWENPELLNGCYGWDWDHGTNRAWRSVRNGKVARISGARLVKWDASMHALAS